VSIIQSARGQQVALGLGRWRRIGFHRLHERQPAQTDQPAQQLAHSRGAGRARRSFRCHEGHAGIGGWAPSSTNILVSARAYAREPLAEHTCLRRSPYYLVVSGCIWLYLDVPAPMSSRGSHASRTRRVCRAAVRRRFPCWTALSIGYGRCPCARAGVGGCGCKPQYSTLCLPREPGAP